MKARLTLQSLLPFVPLMGFVWLLFYGYVAYLEAGHWPPVYGRPDPTSIRPWIAGDVLMGILMMCMAATPIAFVAMLWVSSRRVLFSQTPAQRFQAWAALS